MQSELFLLLQINSPFDAHIFCFLLGAQRDGHVHHQPERVRFDVLLFQFAAGHFSLLPPGLGPRRGPLHAIPADALRTFGRLHFHRLGHHAQSLHHDRPPKALSKVSHYIVPFYFRRKLNRAKLGDRFAKWQTRILD